MKKKSIISLPAPRVKKIIQNDKNIGKLSSQTPAVISKVTELFIEELIKSSSKLATDRDDTKLTLWHLSQVLQNDSKFAFFQSKALNNPALISAEEPKKPKKSKKTEKPKKKE